jgi:hypothetical protein
MTRYEASLITKLHGSFHFARLANGLPQISEIIRHVRCGRGTRRSRSQSIAFPKNDTGLEVRLLGIGLHLEHMSGQATVPDAMTFEASGPVAGSECLQLRLRLVHHFHDPRARRVNLEVVRPRVTVDPGSALRPERALVQQHFARV